MQADDQAPGLTTADPDERSSTLVVRAHWYSVDEAARVLGISRTALRKRIASGELTSMRAGRARRVLILGDRAVSPEGADREDATASRSPERDGTALIEQRRDEVDVLARTAESLTTLVHDLQRQSLALAGQVGYLQHELSQAHERVKRLEQASEAPVAPAPDVDEHTALRQQVESLQREVGVLRDAANRPGRRRGWRFWRR